MNPVLIASICGLIFVIVFVTIMTHDISVQQDKNNQLYTQNLAKSTCADLKQTISFIDQMNEGLWIKQYDDSDVVQYYKEKNCS